MRQKTIGILAGSLRRDSYSKKVAHSLAGLLAERFEVKILEIGNLPLYNQDLDDNGQPPQSWLDLRRDVRGLDGVLFVTPEYNRSLPAALKNALDIASRPYVQNAWSGKPGAVISVTPGKIGGFGAAQHLRQAAACVNIRMMAQPEAYIGEVAVLTDETGVKDERTIKFLQSFGDAFAAWVDCLTA